MQKKMDHFSYAIDEYVNKDIHLAKIYPDPNKENPQPIISVANEYIIAFYGEIFSYDDETKPETCKDGEYFLTLFNRMGFESLKKINGHYAVCIYDTENSTAYLICDRYGTMPVYYAIKSNRLIFASELKAVVQDTDKKEINYQSIAELFSFGHLFGNKTMFQDIHLIPPGSYIKYSAKGLEEVQYWDYPYFEETYFPGRIRKRESNNLQDELAHIMRNAAKRMGNNSQDILLSLSGGLDSRYVAALYHQAGMRNMTAFTMGPEASEDQMYAKEVARRLGFNHYPFAINPEKVWQDAAIFSFVSDGMSMIHGPLQNFEPMQFFYGEKRIVAYSQMCDALFGSTLWRKKIKVLKNTPRLNREAEDILLDIFKVYDQELVKRLFRKEVYQKIQGKYKIEPAGYFKKEHHPLHIYYLLLLNEHGRRGTLGGNLVTNLFFKTRMLSYDNEVFNFGWKLLIAYREYQYLYRMTFVRMFPELAGIKREGYNLKIGASKFRYEMKVFENKLVALADSRNINLLKMLLKSQNRPKYVDYKNWLRNELKKEILSFFMEEPLRSSEIIEPDQAKKLVRLHLEGHNDFSGLLWQLVNLEYFYRNFNV
jgi:hypothetical protein